MSIEVIVFAALKDLAASRVYPDVAPDGAVRPYIVYQGVGGEGVNFLNSANPGKKNMRLQVSVWADTRGAASVLSAQVEDAMRAVVTLQTTVMGAAVSIYEPDTKLRGTHQDFSVWN